MEEIKGRNMELKTPYFVINKELLDKNIDDYMNALKRNWPNSQLAYSVKTNSLPWILEYLREKGLFAEVVSDEEYLLARKCGYGDKSIIFNGPIKGDKLFVESIKAGSYVNLDSKNDLENIYNIELNGKENVGIRLNPDPSIFRVEDVEYTEDGFRFGFSDDTFELKNVIQLLRKNGRLRIGLHLHCNSITRSVEVYKSIAKYAVEIIKKYNLEISYIDIGGGFFGGVPGKTTPDEYIISIKKELEKIIDIEKTKLIIEPGSAIIGSVVDFVTSVIDVKDTLKSRIVTTDGSRINIDPLWIKKQYLYSLEQNETSEPFFKQIICGYTCMDHDRIMKITEQPELKKGDKIIYHRVGAYSMTFGGMFIRYYPNVYVKTGDNLKLVRKRIGIEDYYAIQTNLEGKDGK